MRRVLTGLLALVSVLLMSACSVPGLWTYDDNSGSGAAGGAFDPLAYAATAWTDKVVPAVQEKSADAAELMAAIAADPTAAAATYGVVAAGTGAPAFAVKGTGTVTSVATTPTGPITLDIGGGQTIDVATGPVILGTALRDVTGLTFGDFTNQIDYQNVATQLNNVSKTSVISTIDKTSLTGKTVEFQGAFSFQVGLPVTVVPTQLTVS